MAKRKRNPKWSVFLVREPDRAVRQFHVSRKTVIALPAAAALTVAGTLAGVGLATQQRIQQLEARLAHESAELEKTVAAKEREIASLNRQLEELGREAKALQRRVEQMHELEKKLRSFIETYGEGVSLPAPRSSGKGPEVATASYRPGMDAGAGYATTAYAPADEFEELMMLLDGLEMTMEAIRKKERQRRMEATAEPTGWPTVSRKLTSGYGYRKDPFTGRTTFHAGIDISGETGDPVYAAGSGTVKEAGFHSERGRYIVIAHGNGLESAYYHLHKIEVREGDQVMRGDRIGRLGNTGRSTGPHLHFQVTARDKSVSPLRYLLL